MDNRMLYGVTIHDAIKRSDHAEMQQLLKEARQVHEQQGDLGRAIHDLERAIGGGPGPIIPLYGAAIADVMKRGNKDEMRRLLDDARRQHSEIGSGIQELERALNR